MPSLRRLIVLLAAGSLATGLSAQDPDRLSRFEKRDLLDRSGQPDRDDPTLRREAMLAWYGGKWSPEYRRFLMETAAQEKVRWASLLPGGPVEPVRVPGNHWTNLGPTTATVEKNGSSTLSGTQVPDSGRPRSIVIDPTDNNVLYLATSGGGVWKTTNATAAQPTWTPLSETIGSLSNGSLALDPNNHLTLYLGLGDPFDGMGIGLVKSTDGGSTWSAPVFLGAATATNQVMVCNSDSTVVLAATNAGLWRSTSSGASWSQLSLATGVAGVTPNVWSIAWGGGTNYTITLEADPANATKTQGQVWYSTNNGATWTKSTSFTTTTNSTAGRMTVASAPTDRTTMYIVAAVTNATTASDLLNFFRSTDDGHTWASLGVTSTQKFPNGDRSNIKKVMNGQGWYDQVAIVDPSVKTTVYLGGSLYSALITTALTSPVYAETSDWLAQGGLPYVHADFHAAAFDSAGTLYFGTDGGIFKQTSSASNTWTSVLNNGIVSHLCYSVGSTLGDGTAAQRAAVISGLQDNGTRVRQGATGTFNQFVGGDGFGSHMHVLNANSQIATLYYDQIEKTTNGLLASPTWSAADSGIAEVNNGNTAPFYTKVVGGQADATGNTLYTFSNLNVYKSTNYAGSWTATTAAPITSGAMRNIGAAKSNGSVIGVVCSGGRVFTTLNGGGSWIAAGAPPNNGLYMSYISFSPVSDQVVYTASVAPDQTMNHLWKSLNGGSTWVAIDGSAASSNGLPFGVPINSVVEDPNDSQTVYAGTYLGVYRSKDGGSSWSRFGAALPLVNVTDFYISPDSTLMRVSTFGRGIWEFDTNTGTVSASIGTPSSTVTINSGASVSFSGSATDQDPSSSLTFGWNFGDSATATGSSASHVYTNFTSADVNYTAAFTATGSTGGVGTATRTVTVLKSTPATVVTLTPSLPTPQTAGTPVTFTAAGSGSNALAAGYQYQFWLWNGAWTMVQDFGVGTSYTLPGTAPAGTYSIGVNTRTTTAVSWDKHNFVYPYNIQ